MANSAQPPRLWRLVLAVAPLIVGVFCRLRVTGSVPVELRRGPLILVGNHISNFDPFAVTAACARAGVAPRMMATGGLFRAPVLGPLMRAAGHIPVDRGRDSITNAVPDALAALTEGSVIFIFPEGRIGLDPGLWPERAKTGMARLALASGATVIPVASWGSHEVVAYHGRSAMLWSALRSVWRRPVCRVHFGSPVDLSDLSAGAVGHAQRATLRVLAALTDELATLRGPERGLPRHIDPTRPVSTARSSRHRRR